MPPIESFFGHLKDDVDYQDCRTFKELLMLITEYVGYYNNERQQWDLKKIDPGIITGIIFYLYKLRGFICVH